jgi:hypothetical protein
MAQPIDRERRRPRPRIETLSDLIYGLSLSIGAISLVITNSLASSVNDINRNILEFLFVFLILITSWIIYTSNMSVLPVETRLVIFMNVLLLILVAIFPYLFDQLISPLNTGDVQNYSSILFTIDYGVTLLIMAAFAHIISIEEKQLVATSLITLYKTARTRVFLLSLIVFASLAFPWNWTLFSVPARFYIWAVPVIIYWFNQMAGSPAQVSTQYRT